MNRLIVYLFTGAAFLFVTCQDTKEDLKSPISSKDTYKTVGEAIPFETGMKWIAYYHDQQAAQGRTELLASYSISDTKVAELVASTQNIVGVAFHYGLDDNGTKHIIAIPVDETLRLWTSIPGRIYVDANTGTNVSQSVADAWAQNFKDENPDDVWFHFFGINIINDMSALPFFDSVDIHQGINILGLTPELLLVVYNDLLGIGRSQDDPGMVYDASNPCPPCQVR